MIKKWRPPIFSNCDLSALHKVRLRHKFLSKALKRQIRILDPASTIWCFHRIALWSDSRSRSSPRLYCPCSSPCCKFFSPPWSREMRNEANLWTASAISFNPSPLQQKEERQASTTGGYFPICFFATLSPEATTFVNDIDYNHTQNPMSPTVARSSLARAI